MTTARWPAIVGVVVVTAATAVATVDTPAGVTTDTSPASGASSSRADVFGRVPTYFEANKGQAGPQVGFVARSGGLSAALSATDAGFEVTGPNGRSTLRMQLVGADAGAHQVGQGRLDTEVNYYAGPDPTRWQSNIATYTRVRAKAVYPGVDMVWRGGPGELEYDFIVAPGADPAQIRLGFDGGRPRLDNAELVVGMAGGELRQRAPYLYQVVDGKRRRVDGAFMLQGHQVAFDVGAYDSTKALVIDPVITYSTLLGGPGDDRVADVAVNSKGEVYMTGFIGSASTASPSPWHSVYGAGPPARSGAAMAYHAPTSRAVLFGGRGSNGDWLGDTWAFDGTTWSQLSLDVADAPSPRAYAAMASEPGGGRLVLFGGENGTGRLGETWVFDGVGWRKIPDAGAPATPSRRSRAAMATSTALGGTPGVVLFGGRATNGSLLSDTWMWNGASWVVQASTDAPADRAEAAVATDAAGVVHIFGGVGEAGLLNDFWTWSGTTWTQVAAAATKVPAPRRRAALVRDDAGALSLVGGRSNTTLLGDRWVYRFGSSQPWTKSKYPHARGPRAAAATTRHDGIGAGVVVGGEGPTGALGDTWALETPPQHEKFAFVAKLKASGGALAYVTYLNVAAISIPYRIGLRLEIDADDNAYVAGDTLSTSLPTTPGAYQTTCKLTSRGACQEAFVVVLDPDGGLRYGTYLGGTGGDNLSGGMALGPGGSVYLSGETFSADFPTTEGAYRRSYAFGYLAMLNPGGNGPADLVYSTYVGNHIVRAVAVDAEGAAYLTGEATTKSMPTTPGAFQTTCSDQTTGDSCYDGFVIKIAPSGGGLGDLRYSTYLGGRGSETAYTLAVGPGNTIYVAGSTGSADFPVTPSAFDTSYGCFSDLGCLGFLTKIIPSGGGNADLVYSTFLGSGTADYFLDMLVDSRGRAVMTGRTLAGSFPVKNPVQKRCGCANAAFNTDAVVVKLNPNVMGNGSGVPSDDNRALIFSTFLGGSSNDYGDAVAQDALGNIYVGGSTDSTGFPVTSAPFQSTHGGSRDGFVTKISSVP